VSYTQEYLDEAEADAGGIAAMDQREWMAQQFEAHRQHLRAVAYRMLGSLSEADDALQEAWLRVSKAEASEVENVGGWLTTVVARVCLNLLRSRRTRREESIEVHVPDPLVSFESESDPEQEAILADSVGLALLVVLETLSPAERLAFVLHDMFGVSFEEVAPMVERTPAAARQLASRARRRVRGAAPSPDADLRRQREVVDAFFAAARDGDFEALVAVLDPDVVLRSDGGLRRPESTLVAHGAEAVAARAGSYARLSPWVRPAIVNGVAGVVVAPRGRPFSVMAFTVRAGRIVAIDALSDPDRLSELALDIPDT
jgi:RNA polymerase sigma factor (sigma-70 family)